MLRTLATGFLTRKLGRGMTRRTSNPLLRIAGMAAAGYVANRIFRDRQQKMRRPGNASRRGWASRFA